MVNKAKGQRNTSQRRLLLELLRHSEGHLDAEELYRIAKVWEPRISLSTVYRNLSLFKKLGLVDERHFTEAHHHYEVKQKGEHHHLICLNCGRVAEFEYHLSERFKEGIGRNTGFEVAGGEIYLEGYCEQCRQQRN
jgi:Fur family ferric uptake transcriptional regulator